MRKPSTHPHSAYTFDQLVARLAMLDKPPTLDFASIRGARLKGLRGAVLGLRAYFNYGVGNLVNDDVPGMRELKGEICRFTASEVLGMPAVTPGFVKNNGTESNLDALFLAREKTGRSKIVCSNMTHKSVAFAARKLQMETMAVDARPELGFQMDAGRLLASLDEETAALVLTAGTTELSVIENLPPEIAEKCEELGIWIHVDGAYGGFNMGALPEKYPQRNAVRGLVNSPAVKSVTVDPHKMVGTYDVSILFVKDGLEGGIDEEIYFKGASILTGTTKSAMPVFITLETMKALGASGISTLAESNFKAADYFARCVRHLGMETISEVNAGMVAVRFGSEAAAWAAYERLRAVGFVLAKPVCVRGEGYEPHGLRFVFSPEEYYWRGFLEEMGRVVGSC